MHWHSFINISNSLSLLQSLWPGANFLGIALNFLIIRVYEDVLPLHCLCMIGETVS